MNSMLEQDDAAPPFSPVKVTIFVLLLGLIAFAGWRFLRARAAVSAVAEASKDYRKLFPARVEKAPEPPPKPAAVAAPVSGIVLLKIDDDMRAPKPPAPSAEPPPPTIAAPPVAAAKVEAAAPAKPAPKEFKRSGLNSGAFSRLNGGSGIGYQGRTLSGSGSAPPAANPAAPAPPNIPGLPAVPDKK